MKIAFKSIAIIAREDTPRAMSEAEKLASWLSQQKIAVFCEPGVSLCPDSAPLNSDKELDQIDLVVVLGGDGTYLKAVRLLKGRQTPIVGVNLGSLGFLTDNRIEELYTTLKMTLEGKMENRPRSMLSIKIKGQQLTWLALNDVVIERGGGTHLLNISIHCDGHLVTQTKADGMVIASPTGSTAYNLAAGGPILHPETKAIVITPICPHSLTSRPLLFPEDKTLSFRVIGENRTAQLTIDGQNVMQIGSGDELEVTRHRDSHHVIRHPSHNFFSLLREKFKFGDRD